MPRPGGPASKYGVRYEDRWTADCALRILAGEAKSIYLEGPNSEEGFEFSLELPGGSEFHQVKRQRTGEGHWTLEALDGLGVLSSFIEKLRDPKARCVFASAHAADTLDELCDRAQKFKAWPDFKRQLDAQVRWKGIFEDLSKRWGVEGEQAWEALMRVRVATIGERELLDKTALQVELQLSGARHPRSPIADLVDILRDNVDSELNEEGLWEKLEARGYGRAKLTAGAGPREEIAAANERFKATRRATLINGRLIPREEPSNLLEMFDDEQRVVFLHGEAGAGKSDVLLRFCELLEESGSPYLALRLDRQDATRTAVELGRELQLSASPAAVLAASAGDAPAYLIIDQLDALSASSGRNPQFFEAVAETVSRALSDPRIRVVLSCRTFDAETDSRLRQLAMLAGEEKPTDVKIGRLSERTVSATLRELGIERSDLSASLLGLLTLPAYLSLFVQIVGQGDDEATNIHGLQGLYEAYWRVKSREVDDATGRSDWTEVTDALVDYMSRHQALAAPASVLDAWSLTREEMISAGVLVLDSGQVAFFHETYFDYAYARRFTARGGTLGELLRADQLLFRRAQVRQILDYTRRASPHAYEQNLRLLVEADWVRFHLKDLVFAWLGGLADAGAVEWQIVALVLGSDDQPLKGRAQVAIASPGWFDYLDEQGLLERWLAEDGLRDQALHCLSGSIESRPGRVVELLEPYKDLEGGWRERISGLLYRADLHSGRELVDLQLDLINSGAAGDGEFWTSVYNLAEKRPDWVSELLGAYLRDRLRAATDKGVTNPFNAKAEVIPQQLHIGELINEAADKAPEEFIDEVWPVVVEMVERAIEPRSEGLRADSIWPYRHFGDHYSDFEEYLLLALEKALRGLAAAAPARIEELAAEQTDTEVEAIVALLYTGFAANPKALAPTAIEFLLADRRRLRVGYSDGDHWGTRKLLEAVTPDAPDDALKGLEVVLLDYYTPWEKSKAGHKAHGMNQFRLLNGIAEERRSPRVKARIAEWQRKFEQPDADPPFGIQSGTVKSPIAKQAAEKMSDENWKRAMERYRGEESWSDRIVFDKGDARELSIVLEEEAKRDPDRFAKLATELGDEVKLDYFEAVLRGVGESETQISSDGCAALVKRCHALPGHPCGQWIGYPLRSRVDQPIDPELLEIVGWYATNGDPDSTVGVSSEPDKRERQLAYLNSVRGGIATQIARFVYGNSANIGPLLPAIESLLSDAHPGVREAAMEIPLRMLRHDDARALQLFLRGAEDAPDVVLASRGAHEFLRYRANQYFDELGPVIERMVRSAEPEVREAGATQAGLLALGRSQARPLFEECLSGDPQMRRGVARVAAVNYKTARFRQLCEEALFSLFDDVDPEVRKEAAGAIRGIGEGEEPDSIDALLRGFLSSMAFRDEPGIVLLAMHEEIIPNTELALEATEAVILSVAAPADVRRHDAMVARWANEVLMRIYADALSDSTRERALDLFDRNLHLGVYGAERELEKYDRE